MSTAGQVADYLARTGVIELVGPKGYVHGWKFVGVPGVSSFLKKAGHAKSEKVKGSSIRSEVTGSSLGLYTRGHVVTAAPGGGAHVYMSGSSERDLMRGPGIASNEGTLTDRQRSLERGGFEVTRHAAKPGYPEHLRVTRRKQPDAAGFRQTNPGESPNPLQRRFAAVKQSQAAEESSQTRQRLGLSPINPTGSPAQQRVTGAPSHADLLHNRSEARRYYPPGHPERLRAERAVRQSRKARAPERAARSGRLSGDRMSATEKKQQKASRVSRGESAGTQRSRQQSEMDQLTDNQKAVYYRLKREGLSTDEALAQAKGGGLSPEAKTKIRESFNRTVVNWQAAKRRSSAKAAGPTSMQAAARSMANLEETLRKLGAVRTRNGWKLP